VHCLRHGFVTLMLAMGVPVAHVMRLVGHENMATTQKYLHLAGLDAGWQAYTAGPLGKAIGHQQTEVLDLLGRLVVST
jgi:hypothetical protein